MASSMMRVGARSVGLQNGVRWKPILMTLAYTATTTTTSQVRDGPMTATGPSTIIRGGRLLDVRAHRAEPADVLVTGDTIAEIGAPGLAAPAHARVLDARGLLLHAGLINAHMHAHGNLAKGMGDLWTLELLLTAAPWISGNRSPEERALSAKLGAVEMVLKGCTATYDLPLELPAPSLEGLER